MAARSKAGAGVSTRDLALAMEPVETSSDNFYPHPHSHHQLQQNGNANANGGGGHDSALSILSHAAMRSNSHDPAAASSSTTPPITNHNNQHNRHNSHLHHHHHHHGAHANAHTHAHAYNPSPSTNAIGTGTDYHSTVQRANIRPEFLDSVNFNLRDLPVSEMETLVFNPSTHHNGRQNFMGASPSPFRGIGREISNNYAANLGILNAESYVPPVVTETPEQYETRKFAGDAAVGAFGYEPARPDVVEVVEEPESGNAGVTARRKGKRARESPEGDEESRKKSRGRPRVDAKDETAADRRRTQIRMAQRAYRHRKETTISSLEKQVQDLRGNNEEMSNVFLAFHEFIASKGILQRDPEMAQQLQSTTERFLALAKQSSDIGLDDQQGDESEKHDEPETSKPRRRDKKTPTKTTPTLEKQASASITWDESPIGKSQAPVEEMQMDYFNDKARTDQLQVITRPTEENASFPWEFPNAMDLQQYRVEVPSPQDFSQLLLPQSQPPLPKSYAWSEFSFARRLQRGALEAAFQLVSMPNPPPARFKRVFSFCATFETLEAIKARLGERLAVSSKDTLMNWRFPFHHIGNAGTHYPYPAHDRSPIGMPYNMGPFAEAVSQTQDEFFDETMRCNYPGWQSELFDANDVEGYLRSRGLDISPAAELVTAQIDLTLLNGGSTPRENSSSTGSTSVTTLSPKTPSTPLENLLGAGTEAYKPDVNALPFPLGFTSWDSDGSNTREAANIDPIFHMIDAREAAKRTPETSSEDAAGRLTITFSVQTLLTEIISRGVCLGRSPGFRPSDVNAAIVAAAKAGVV